LIHANGPEYMTHKVEKSARVLSDQPRR
jgi:hypothetical protein